MFFHNFKYTLKYLFRNRLLIFWTYAFPIILGALFYLAFSDIEKNEKMDIIDIAVVEEETAAAGQESELQEEAAFSGQDNESPEGSVLSNREILLESIEELSDKDNEDRLFHTVYVSKEEAEELLKKSEITGYLLVDGETPKVVVKESGINETILQQAVGEILQTGKMTAVLTEAEVKRQAAEAVAAYGVAGAETSGNTDPRGTDYSAGTVDVEAISENVLKEIREAVAKLLDITREKESMAE